MNSKYTIGVLGLWHLGENYSVGLAEIGHSVIGISDDATVVENFLKNIPPLAESRLEELLSKNQSEGHLLYTTDFGKLRDCNVLWFAFDTPVDDDDNVDVTSIFDALKKTIPYLQDNILIVASSQLPVGTSEKLKAMIREARPELRFEYAYTPENLRLGDAVKCFLEPGRVVVGADTEEALKRMKEIFEPLKAEIVSMSSPSAEMAKHALNAFLATSISFTNDLADVCERVGADIEDVARALKTDPRIGPKSYLFAGLGFSGGTLGRDLRALMKIAAEKNINLPVITSVFQKNRSRNALVEEHLIQTLGDLKGKTFAMFGITYKAGTSTLRRSQPLEIEKSMRENGINLKLYDPLAKADEVKLMTLSLFSNDPYMTAEGVDGILIMNPTPDFKNLDFGKLKEKVKSALIFDTCNILPQKENEIKSAGFKYISIGRP